MDKIRVYKTYNAADMVAILPYLKGVLQSFPGFMSQNSQIQMGNNGSWRASADSSLTNSLPKANIIKSEKEAFGSAQKWMQKFDENLSSKVVGSQLPKRLFGSDLLEISATPEIKEIYGMKVPLFWHCHYRLSVRPDNSTKAIAVDNMELHLSIHSSNVVNIDYSYLPIKESSEEEKVIVNQPLGLGYQNIPDKNLIIPYFYIIENENSND